MLGVTVLIPIKVRSCSPFQVTERVEELNFPRRRQRRSPLTHPLFLLSLSDLIIALRLLTFFSLFSSAALT